MIYSNDDLDRIKDEYERLSTKCDRLFLHYHRAGRGLSNERAREYAVHGFCRRLKTLEHCIVRIFETIPPDCSQQPDQLQLHDATIFLQAFVFNVFGCVDNLAHIWVQEKRLTRPGGKELPDSAVGFSKKNRDVLDSLPTEFHSYITGAKYLEWCRVIGDFRHALAHRIPLYIPPFVVQRRDMSRFNEIGCLMDRAVLRGEYSHALDLMRKQKEIGVFLPGVTHSFVEEARPILIHPQVLADFSTVEDVAQRLLDALCGPSR